MADVENGISFALSSSYLEASSKIFEKEDKITVYVESFEDTSFWLDKFSDLPNSIDVRAFTLDENANGKGSIISSIRKGAIVLGPYLVVALDSDYDYLLDINNDIFESDFVFQTYAYSIENLLWHPKRLAEICNKAVNCSQVDSEEILSAFSGWSQLIYSDFISQLESESPNKKQVRALIDLFKENDLSYDYSQDPFPKKLVGSEAEQYNLKGLTQENVYLFVRGHCFEEKAKKLCKRLTSNAIRRTIKQLKSNLGMDAKQAITEYTNKNRRPEDLVVMGAIDCDICIPKIKVDIGKFKASYHA